MGVFDLRQAKRGSGDGEPVTPVIEFPKTSKKGIHGACYSPITGKYALTTTLENNLKIFDMTNNSSGADRCKYITFPFFCCEFSHTILPEFINNPEDPEESIMKWITTKFQVQLLITSLVQVLKLFHTIISLADGWRHSKPFGIRRGKTSSSSEAWNNLEGYHSPTFDSFSSNI